MCGFVVSAWRATFSAARFEVIFAAMRLARLLVVVIAVIAAIAVIAVIAVIIVIAVIVVIVVIVVIAEPRETVLSNFRGPRDSSRDDLLPSPLELSQTR